MLYLFWSYFFQVCKNVLYIYRPRNVIANSYRPTRRNSTMNDDVIRCKRLLFRLSLCDGEFRQREHALNATSVVRIWYSEVLHCNKITDIKKRTHRTLQNKKLCWRREKARRTILIKTYLSAVALLFKKFRFWKSLQQPAIGELYLEGLPGSSEFPLLNRPYITSY